MSIDTNLVIFGGRLTDDPMEIASGKGAKFDVASNRRYRSKESELKEDTTYMSITCWSRLAASVLKYGFKGQTVLVVGRLETRKVKDKLTGENKKFTNVVADDVKFIDYKKDKQEYAKKPDEDLGRAEQLVRDLIG